MRKYKLDVVGARGGGYFFLLGWDGGWEVRKRVVMKKEFAIEKSEERSYREAEG